MTEKFTDRIYPKIKNLWNACLNHPFVQELGEGSLDLDKFKHWVKQDYVYLIEYARLFAIGTSKSYDLETMNSFAKGLDGVLFMEMDLHKSYAKTFSISEEELESTEKSAINTAYTSYMLNKAQAGGVENVAAALLACSWSYNYIGLELAKVPGALEDKNYGSWIKMYSSDEFTELNNNAMELMNKLADGKPERELKILEDIIVKTGYFEYMFWDMCYKKESWPINL
ncbi:thiaminase II [uncultured Anaerococcus sp.]|uniref:thiaminase II n=1 Tax=uncultured Anaerococcus sp. TaxID=293428 RepID=UPI0026132C83|nr:thiaminase II [uncultured Anaerococcus sp.]